MISATAALIAMAAVSAASPPLLGTFSNGDAVFIAGADRSELKLGCSGGSIGGPIHLDGHRRFVATGSFEDHNPGPQMVEDGVQAQPPVRFAGRVSGDTLALTVERRGAPPLKLSLRRGPVPKLVRCY